MFFNETKNGKTTKLDIHRGTGRKLRFCGRTSCDNDSLNMRRICKKKPQSHAQLDPVHSQIGAIPKAI